MDSLMVSDQMINELRDVIIRHDAQAQDTIRFAQYLSSISAILIAEQDGSAEQLENLLSQLFNFSQHVFQQQISEKTQSDYANQEIYGVWRPE